VKRLVGQDAILRGVGNAAIRKRTKFRQADFANRPQVDNLPHWVTR